MTKTPFSTISYNTEAFLKNVLDDLMRQHIIIAYQYICHVGELGDKNHIHLRCVPNKSVDLMDILPMFEEFDASNPKPRGCLTPRPSKEEDWLLYAVHEPTYLAMHGIPDTEKIPYKKEDIKCNEGYYLDESFARAMATLLHSSASIVKSLRSGKTAISLVTEGFNPLQVNSVKRLMSHDEFDSIMAERDEWHRKFDLLKCTIEKYGYKVNYTGNEFTLDLSQYDEIFNIKY